MPKLCFLCTTCLQCDVCVFSLASLYVHSLCMLTFIARFSFYAFYIKVYLKIAIGIDVIISFSSLVIRQFLVS